MRALVLTKHGGPEVLAVKDVIDPKPSPGEVSVRVHAAGLNFADVMARMGLYPDAPKPPCVLGYEIAGVIEESNDAQFPSGMRVMAMTRFGGHAEKICVKKRQIVPMPAGMTFEEAAAIPVNYLTAYHMLFNIAHLKDGATVLIHMAAGGVGSAAIQLCRTVPHVTVIGTAGSKKHDFIRQLGCDHAIDRSQDYVPEVKKLTHGQGVNLVLDPLGGDDWRKGYSLLRPTGMLISFGFANLAKGSRRNIPNILKQLWRVPKFEPVKLMQENKAVAGDSLGHLWQEHQSLTKSPISYQQTLRTKGL